jgi:hypothetical protein
MTDRRRAEPVSATTAVFLQARVRRARRATLTE